MKCNETDLNSSQNMCVAFSLSFSVHVFWTIINRSHCHKINIESKSFAAPILIFVVTI